MSFERATRDGAVTGSETADRDSSALVPGKRTLVEPAYATIAAAPPVQRHASAEQAAVPIHDAAARGTATPASELPHAAKIQSLFGHHDISGIQAHTGPEASASAREMGADAYATGNHVVLGSGTDLRTVAHEAAHVVQQRGGVQLKGGVGVVGDAYEQHADAVADAVVQGESAEGLLDIYAARPAAPSPAGSGVVQRHAFVNGVQVLKGDPDATGAVAAMVTDATVRDYSSKDELKRHAAKQTDYLGNLKDGTWVRFSPTGTNVLGENHTQVTLDQVAPAVGSTSFVYEPFSSDSLANGSHIKAAYETENSDLFKKMGVGGVQNKQQFGAESLFPKMGTALTLALPYFEGKKPLAGLKSTSYVGQPVQRYLKIAWGHSEDNLGEVTAKQKAGQPVTPKRQALAKAHEAVAGALGPFIIGLAVDGYLGDVLDTPAHRPLLPKLATFAHAFVDAMVELAAEDPSSRLDPKARGDIQAGKGPSDPTQLFADWRNYKFEDAIKDAVKRGVRYAGMGQNHLTHLKQVALAPSAHPYEMSGKDILSFMDHTEDLKKKAVPQ